MSAMLRTIGRVMATFALLIRVGAGVLAAAAPVQAAHATPRAGRSGRDETVAGFAAGQATIQRTNRMTPLDHTEEQRQQRQPGEHAGEEPPPRCPAATHPAQHRHL